MSQSNFQLDNVSASAARTKINEMVKANASLSSGLTEPTSPLASQLWFDTTDDVLKQRNKTNDSWISIGYLDQSDNKFKLFDGTIIATTSGTKVGRLGVQTDLAWEEGTSTEATLVSPAQVLSLASKSLGFNQSYVEVTHVVGQSYENIEDRPIMFSCMLANTSPSGSAFLQVSSDEVTWVTIVATAAGMAADEGVPVSMVIPPSHFYRTFASGASTPVVSYPRELK